VVPRCYLILAAFAGALATSGDQPVSGVAAGR
jgi:hypothetical protein